MNSFDMDEAATTLVDSRSAHSLAREVLELRAERHKALVGADAGQTMNALLGVAMEKGGITRLAKQTGLARGNLYRILSENGNPTLSTLLTILDALDLQLKISEKHFEGGA